jgi:hypothetical protein
VKPVTNTLTEIFNADVRYVVPLYQRPYVWTQDRHWQPLWEDIQILLEHYLNTDDEPVRHFLGAIVLDQQDTPPGQPVRRLVIDGQQRLTTMQLLLAAAARRAERDGAERQARLLRKLTENDPDLATGDERFKVWPTNANQAAFREVMADGGPPGGTDDPDNTIHEAFTYFDGAIERWAQDGAPASDAIVDRYEALRVALASLLQIVSINLDPGDNAQVIFESLNARGTPLLAMDLVKNALFYGASRQSADMDAINATVWEPELGQEYWRERVRQGRLTRPRAELFLMHWLAMRLARIVPATELFTQFRAHVLQSPTVGPLADLIAEMCDDAKVFRGFDAYPPGTVEERFFRTLDVLDTTTLLPIALLVYRPAHEVADPRRHRTLQALESWLVRRMLCGFTAQAYNRLVGDLLKRLHADLSRPDEVTVAFLRSSRANSAVWPTDDEVKAAIRTRPAYGWINQRRLVMLLAALELELRRSSKVEDIYTLPGNLTIEHVMPQKWLEHWPLPAGRDQDDRDRHIHLLGNLTLTSGPLNSALSNAPWPTKRTALPQHSLLSLNQRIAGVEHWDEDAIDARGAELGEAICRIWRGPSAGVWTAGAAAEAPVAG